MVLQVPNYLITIKNDRGTSKQRFSPKYEMPLIEALFANSAPGKKNPEITCKPIPDAGSKAATDEETGRDRFAGQRFTRAISLAHEKKRLQHFYGDDKAKGLHIFNHTFPVDTFEEQAQRMYPSVFGAPSNKFEVEVEEQSADEIADDTSDIVDPPENEVVDEETEDKIDDLQQIRYVGPKTAKSLFAAGFTSIEEIAQTDPLDIEMIKGVSTKEAKAIVDHAVELGKDSDDIASITG